MNKREREKT